jgi:hypothetical protein
MKTEVEEFRKKVNDFLLMVNIAVKSTGPDTSYEENFCELLESGCELRDNVVNDKLKEETKLVKLQINNLNKGSRKYTRDALKFMEKELFK